MYNKINEEFNKVIKNNQIQLRFHTELKELVYEATKFLGEDASNSERIYCIRNYIYNRPTCKSCNKELKFNTKTTKYNTYCSNKCSNSDKDKKDKIKKSLIDNYGVDNPMKNEDIKRKAISNNNLQECYNKMKDTMISKYGTDNPMSVDSIKHKCISTIKERYGVDNVMKLDSNKRMLSSTNCSLSYDNIISREGFLDRVTPMFTKETYKGRFANNLYKCNICGKEFTDWIDSTYKFIPRCPICFPPKTSMFEHEVYMTIKDILGDDITIIRNDRKVLDGLELDIYIPELNIAIEVNGLYWHSELIHSDNMYHYNKFKLCKDKRIRLIQILEDEWLYKKGIVISKLKHILNKNDVPRVYARKCHISIVSYNDKKSFLESNDIKGDDDSSLYIGLYYGHALVAIMTFRKYNSVYYELSRYTTNKDYIVVGSFSKLLKHSCKLYNIDNIVTYVDLRWSLGRLYRKHKFTLIGQTKPDYWYIKRSGKSDRYHKSFNVSLEKDNYTKIWDTGNLVFKLQSTSSEAL